MAQIPGERFEIDLNDDNVAPHEQASGLIGDVREREIRSEIAPPSFKGARSATGFPEHKKRAGGSKFRQDRGGDGVAGVATAPSALSTVAPNIAVQNATPIDKMRNPFSNNGDLSERQQIDDENKKAIASMSEDEITAERQELFAGLSPALIEKLLKRSNIDDEPSQIQRRASPKVVPADSENRRPSYPERKVSFALPEEKIAKAEPSPTAARHSITSSPSPLLAAKIGTPSSSDVSELGLSRTSSNTSISSRRSSTSHERKVSFVLPDYIELARKASPTAAKHSISSPMTIAEDKKETPKDEIADLDLTRTPSNSALKSPGQRPVDHKRKVSFALPDSQLVPEGRRPSSAASHSISGSPSPKFMSNFDSTLQDPVEEFELPPHSHSRSVHFEEPEDVSVHFPKPPAAPELDPNAPTFLDDLHQKYFPNLAHDPSKLAWMTPATAEEDAAYDPSRENLAPKDIRFDFKGKIIPPSQSARISTDAGLHHHGDAPSAAGYTISELGILSRSAFPAQRSIAIQTAGRILYRLGKGEFGDENLVEAEGPVGERGMLAKGLWDAIEENRLVDTITAEASKESGHQTSIALAQEAVWNWRKGGGRQRKAV